MVGQRSIKARLAALERKCSALRLGLRCKVCHAPDRRVGGGVVLFAGIGEPEPRVPACIACARPVDNRGETLLRLNEATGEVEHAPMVKLMLRERPTGEQPKVLVCPAAAHARVPALDGDGA